MKVVCKICGRQFETLSSHMNRAHGITIKDYLEQYPNSQIISEEYREKQSKAMSRRNRSLEFSEYISERNRENWKLKDYREKQVLSMIKKRNAAVKGVHYSNKCKTFVAYKSELEFKYAVSLDNDEKVESYDSESFVIWYEHCGEDKMYIPDFFVEYVDGRKAVVEIKPYFHHSAHDDLLRDKFNAAQEYCKEHGYLFYIVNG